MRKVIQSLQAVGRSGFISSSSKDVLKDKDGLGGERGERGNGNNAKNSPNISPTSSSTSMDSASWSAGDLQLLPRECIRVVKSNNIHAEEAQKHFEVLCHVLLIECKRKPQLKTTIEGILKERRTSRKRLEQERRRKERAEKRKEKKRTQKPVTPLTTTSTVSDESAPNSHRSDPASPAEPQALSAPGTSSLPETSNSPSTSSTSPVPSASSSTSTSKQQRKKRKKRKPTSVNKSKTISETKEKEGKGKEEDKDNKVEGKQDEKKKRKKRNRHHKTTKDANGKLEGDVKTLGEMDKANQTKDAQGSSTRSAAQKRSDMKKRQTEGGGRRKERRKEEEKKITKETRENITKSEGSRKKVEVIAPNGQQGKENAPAGKEENRKVEDTKTPSSLSSPGASPRSPSSTSVVIVSMNKSASLAELDNLLKEADPSKAFTGKSKIGHGAFGEVFTAKDVQRNCMVAVKILKRKYDASPHAVRNEINVLKSCSHPNIVNYLDSYLHNNKVWVVMEYCDGGTLHQLLTEVTLSERQIAFICKEMLSGLSYLHSQSRIHRDIKSDNVLLNLNGYVKLADLGLCAEVTEDRQKMSVVGSRFWMAPEMIKRERYTSKVDIWSMAAVCYEMSEGLPPYFKYKSFKAMFRTATQGAPPLRNPGKWSRSYQDFLSRCFDPNPNTRASAPELLAHPFLNKSCDRSKLAQSIELVFLGNSLRMNGF